MRGAVDLLQLPDRHVRVNLRCLQVRVSQHRLDEADIGSAFQHQRRHRVAEQVTRPALAEIRRVHIGALSRSISESGILAIRSTSKTRCR